jgi:peptidase E
LENKKKKIINMPYKSKAQEAYFNIHKNELEKQGVDVSEWNKASKGMKLPEKVSKLKSMKKRK